MRRAHAILSLALTLATSHYAAAQCEGRWILGPDQIPPRSWNIEFYQPTELEFRPVFATLAWDRDGDGLDHQLIIGGKFIQDTFDNDLLRIARWNGQNWEQLGEGLSHTSSVPVVYALAAWDAQDDSGGPTEVIAAGLFNKSGSTVLANIARWNGVQWRPLPDGGIAGGFVRALTLWDRDGDGPLPPDLVAAGSFTTAGGTIVNRIARNDGHQWLPLGAGLDNEVWALASWDPDGPGPQTPKLIAGGTFLNAGGQPANNIAIWDGAQWSPLGAGCNSAVYGLTSWDVDNDGPQTPRLVATGRFTAAGGSGASRIASWDGAQWSALSTGFGLVPGSSLPTCIGYGLSTFDRDGSGPAPRELVAVGAFQIAGGVQAFGAAAWNGSQWRDVDKYLGGQPSPARYTIPYTISTWDPDGPGPRQEMLFAGGDFLTAGGSASTASPLSSRHVAISDGIMWQPMVSGMDWPASVLMNWDPDGPGPARTQMVMGGEFRIAGGQRAPRIIAWDGDDWKPFDTGLIGHYVKALHSWDPDGSGPQTPQLLAAHDEGGTPSNYLGRWDGSHWQSFGDPTWTQEVNSITDWDPDGTGPLTSRPTVGRSSGVRAWNGTQWVLLGAFNEVVDAVTTWDPDGAGPAAPLLIAAGDFTSLSSSATPLNHVAAFDGTQWAPLASGVEGAVSTIKSWDPDGAGPLPPRLIAAGSFLVAGGTATRRIAYYDGTAWRPFGPGLGDVVRTVATWDPDGPGPGPTEILAGGDFVSDGEGGGGPLFHIARWDGVQWQPLGEGTNGNTVLAIAPFERDGPGSAPVELLISGEFDLVGGQLSYAWSRWSPAGNPWIASDPAAQSVSAGAAASFTAAPASGYDFNGPLSFQWRRNGVDISDGPGGASAGGGTVTRATGTFWGTTFAPLTITGAQPSDAGGYDCIISNTCGSATTIAAVLTVTAATCPADLNGDGIIDFADYLEFLNLFDAQDPRVDYNMDGIVDFSDYLEFLNHFDAGC